jgi:hypothetical protein
MIVVAVIATIYLGPEMLELIAPGVPAAEASIGQLVVAGAMTGATSSGISQAVGIAIGAQTDFNWKGLALSAIGGGISAGLGGIGGHGGIDFTGSGSASSIGNRILQAGVGNALTQGIGVVTGLQRSFDWRGVAASAAGAGVGQMVAGELHNTSFADTFGKFGVGSAASFAGGLTAAVMRGGRVSVQQVAIDAFGNALGASIADGSSSAGNFSGEGSARSPYVAPDTGDHIVLGAAPKHSWATIDGIDARPYAPQAPDTSEDVLVANGSADPYPYESVAWGAPASKGTLREIVVTARSVPDDLVKGLGDFGSVPEVSRIASTTGSISAINAWDSFFIFNSLGRGLKGVGGAAADAVLAPYHAVTGAENLLRDAWGYVANTVAPGQPGDYLPKSGLIRSLQQNGLTGTVGLGITGAVRNAPGIGLIGALGATSRDWGNVGAQTFNTAVANAGLLARGLVTPKAPPVLTYGRYGSADAFGAEAFARYQRYTDEAYAATLRAEQRGRLNIPPGISRDTIVGQRTDAIARTRMERWLRNEGIAEGPGQTVQLNRWLRDPSGSGSYRIPDFSFPGGSSIMDGTIGWKWFTTRQVTDFYNFSGGSRITIVRPTELGGSYSVLPPR